MLDFALVIKPRLFEFSNDILQCCLCDHVINDVLDDSVGLIDGGFGHFEQQAHLAAHFLKRGKLALVNPFLGT